MNDDEDDNNEGDDDSDDLDVDDMINQYKKLA